MFAEDRIRDRWGIGLEAPDAGVRAFFPDGWVLERDVWQAIAAFGLNQSFTYGGEGGAIFYCRYL